MMLNDNEDIVSSVSKIRKKYKTEISEEESVSSSFIDDLNSLIRKIFKDDPTDIYTALTPGELEKWKNSKFKRFIRKFLNKFSWMNLFYILLLTCITSFLVSEAVSFYANEGSSTLKTYFKAILTEVCFIFLSGYVASGKLQNFIVGALRVAIFSLMLFVITSSIIFKGATTSTEVSGIAQQISLLEDQIKKKETTIEFYRNKGWGVSVNRHEQERDRMSKELLELRKIQTGGKSVEVSDVAKWQTYGGAAFRIMLLLISVLITRRLFKF